ncbi:MAG TPA: hypothetical protein VJX16_23590 [Terriglobales bacterium]|nr:hypothetical protein [Terriglobales bacterium]
MKKAIGVLTSLLGGAIISVLATLLFLVLTARITEIRSGPVFSQVADDPGREEADRRSESFLHYGYRTTMAAGFVGGTYLTWRLLKRRVKQR